MSSRILPAQVEVALTRGDIETARAAMEELERIAEEYERPAFQAVALTARGAVLLGEGDHAGSIRELTKAGRVWREVGFPYEGARARLLLGEAYLGAGDESQARMELGAARSVFEKLGAAIDLRRLDSVISGLGGQAAKRARVTKTFMFTDIVTSTDLVGIMGDSAWESLLAWHDRELRAAFAAYRGVEVSHTGDGFFVAFDPGIDAVEAAVSIQRRLADHRRQHGFAPSVRIGLHTDEATIDVNDYRGLGVHRAARVSAAAEGDEIVASAAALEAADAVRFPVSEGRDVELKGIEGAVRIHTIDWKATASA